MQRYDRQVRLWTSSGQQSLAQSSVAAFGGSAVMRECLKNLALAGVGFLHWECDGSFLRELNPDLQLIARQPAYELVVADDDSVPQELQSPCLILSCGGLTGSVELELCDPLPVLYPHPATLADLRFTEIWPDLQQFCDHFDLRKLNEQDFRRVPFCVLLIKAVQQTEQLSATNVQASLASMQRFGDEENFEEAKKHVYSIFRPRIPPGISQMVDCDLGTSYFAQCVSALGAFIAKHNCLPVSGEIPDMTANTKDYNELRRIYKEKARKDAEELAPDGVPREYVQAFCRNSRFVKVLLPRTEQARVKQDRTSLQLPPVASFIGGIAGQEATKILSGHYTPIAGRLEYDGTTQNTRLETTCDVLN